MGPNDPDMLRHWYPKVMQDSPPPSLALHISKSAARTRPHCLTLRPALTLFHLSTTRDLTSLP